MAALPEFIAEAAVELEAEPAAAPAAVLDLLMTVDKSDLDDWCWAAVSLGIARGYGNVAETMQCQIASRVHNNSKKFCCAPSHHAPANCNVPEELPEPLKDHFNGELQAPDHRQFKFLKEELDAGHPVAVRIEWADSEKHGHFVVVAGYTIEDETHQVLHVWDPQLKLTDPLPIPFDTFRDAFPGNGSWERSYLTKGAPNSLQQVPKKEQPL